MTGESRFNEIQGNLSDVQRRIVAAAHESGRNPDEIKLIVVTKNFPVSDAEFLYELGIRSMGENRDEEGARKSEQLPSDIEWHFQGQIQSRKIKSIAGWADVVHSMDAISHAQKFDALPDGKSAQFFIQINFESDRPDRGGVLVRDVDDFLAHLASESSIKPVGLMTVAPREAEPLQVFEELRLLKERVANTYPEMAFLSMGMSGDFEAAIRAGATHIRVGSSILGSRELLA